MTEQTHVKKCLQEILQKNRLPETQELTQRHFEFLSIEIEGKTGILISVSTIKRLLNGDFSKMPQTATLNAISTYLGYKNWLEYKTNNNGISEEILVQSNTEKPQLKHYKVLILSILLLPLLTFSFVKIRSFSSKNYESAQFSAQKTTDNSIPNTVVFTFDIDRVEADSFFIQQSWDKYRRVRIYKNQHTLTDIYYEPGQHTAKLIANDSIIKTFPVNIPSDKWLSYARFLYQADMPIYFKEDRTNKGFFKITEKNLIENHINPLDNKTYFTVNFPSKKLISGSDFIYQSRVKVAKSGQNLCTYLLNEIFTERHTLYIKSTEKGCASEANAQIGEQFISGKTHDNSGLCTDLSVWTDFRIEVRNKQITVFINNSKVFDNHFTQDLGDIKGVGFLANGLLEADFVKVTDLTGNMVFSEDFN